MSNAAINWAMYQTAGSPTAKLILFKLADQANDDGYCWPSQKTMAEQCEVNRSTINRNIKKLADNGLVEIIPRSADGVSLPNVYQLNLDGVSSETGVGAEDHTRGRTESQGVGAQSHRGGRTEAHKPSSNPHIEPSLNHAGKRQRPIPEDFEPNETCRRVAKELGIPLADELPQFIDHWLAKGETKRDWQAAFRTWLRNAKKYSKRKSSSTGDQTLDDILERAR